MYALAIIRYRKPLEEVLVHQDAHRAYLRGLKEKGVLIASGPMNPRFGGLCCCALQTMMRRRSTRSATTTRSFSRGVAQYELIGWNPVIGKDDLDRL